MRTILFIVRKETFQVLRDRIMLVQIFAAPILQLLILAQAMTFEVGQTHLALVDRDRSPASERLIESFTSSGRFRVVLRTSDASHANRALLEREANAVLHISEGFSRDLMRGRSPSVQLVLNAEDGAAAGVVQSYAVRILADFSQTEASNIRRAAMGPSQPAGHVTIQTRTLYNPQLEYLSFMAIGLLAALMTIVGVLLTAQNIAREKEIGTLEQLNVTPITRTQFIAGKLIPFWVLGLIELTVGLSIIRFAFGIPFEGSVALVYLGAAVYLLAALGLGLLVSTTAQTLQQAQFITFFVMVTFLFFGGIFTPVQSMPEWAQLVAEANPIKHFAFILRTVLIKGGTWGDIAGELGAMLLFAAAVIGVAVLRHRKTAA